MPRLRFYASGYHDFDDLPWRCGRQRQKNEGRKMKRVAVHFFTTIFLPSSAQPQRTKPLESNAVNCGLVGCPAADEKVRLRRSGRCLSSCDSVRRMDVCRPATPLAGC